MSKWVKADGAMLSDAEYRMLQTSASERGIPLVDFMLTYGVVEKYSTGELQDPLNNSAILTAWTKTDDRRVLFLPLWKYKTYFGEAKRLDVSMAEYLTDAGYEMWSSRFKEPVTSWIDGETREPLYRREYVKLLKGVPSESTVSDYLLALGYVKWKESKRSAVSG